MVKIKRSELVIAALLITARAVAKAQLRSVAAENYFNVVPAASRKMKPPIHPIPFC
jgi:hypothetical protein